jgi:glucose-1-phosphate thymidylyltransferase
MRRSLQAVILAAGRGKRLQPLTIQRSKGMLPVAGKPLVERVMERLRGGGITRFILVINPNDRLLQEHVTNSSAWQGWVKFAYQEQSLGAGDALRQAAHLIEGNFLLSACDNLVSQGDVRCLLQTWQTNPNLDGLLSLLELPAEQISQSSSVALAGRQVIQIIEKPIQSSAPSSVASLPLYCFSPTILEQLADLKESPRGEIELQDAIQAMIEQGRPVEGLFLQDRQQVSNVEDLLRLNLDYLQLKDVPRFEHADLPAGCEMIEPVCIEPGVFLGNGCRLGPNVYLESQARVESDGRLENTVVLGGGCVPAGMQVSNQLIWAREHHTGNYL